MFDMDLLNPNDRHSPIFRIAFPLTNLLHTMSSAWSPDELVRLANKLQNAAQLVVASFREAPNEPTNSESGGNLDAQQNISQCIAELQRLTTSPGDFLNRQAIQVRPPTPGFCAASLTNDSVSILRVFAGFAISISCLTSPSTTMYPTRMLQTRQAFR